LRTGRMVTHLLISVIKNRYLPSVTPFPAPASWSG
jgi:hypothetical protein